MQSFSVENWEVLSLLSQHCCIFPPHTFTSLVNIAEVQSGLRDEAQGPPGQHSDAAVALVQWLQNTAKGQPVWLVIQVCLACGAQSHVKANVLYHLQKGVLECTFWDCKVCEHKCATSKVSVSDFWADHFHPWNVSWHYGKRCFNLEKTRCYFTLNMFVFNNFKIEMKRINITAIQYLNILIICLYVLNY